MGIQRYRLRKNLARNCVCIRSALNLNGFTLNPALRRCIRVFDDAVRHPTCSTNQIFPKNIRDLSENYGHLFPFLSRTWYLVLVVSDLVVIRSGSPACHRGHVGSPHVRRRLSPRSSFQVQSNKFGFLANGACSTVSTRPPRAPARPRRAASLRFWWVDRASHFLFRDWRARFFVFLRIVSEETYQLSPILISNDCSPKT